MAGMDDEDIEYELSKMEEAERRREAPPQPLRTVYRPVDPGLAARIFRQMGQPYDPQAIDPRESFYINGGWDYGDEDDTLVEKNRRMEPAPLRNGAMGPGEYDPWEKAWKLDWGEEDRPAEKARTMEFRWGQDGAGVPSRGRVGNALGYGPARADAVSGMREMSYIASGGGEGGGTMKAGPLDKVVGPAGEIIQKGIEVDQFVKEVEAEALKNGDSPELAKKKGLDAASKYTAYLLGVSGATILAGRASGYGPAIVGTAGTVAGAYAMKPLIKKHVLGKSEADYDSEVEEEPLHGGD